MPPAWRSWVHVTKLDPDRPFTPELVEGVVTSGTDALVLSGTLNVTQENLARLLATVKDHGLPLVIEPPGPEAVRFEGIDLLFVPSVLNSCDPQWIVGKHRDWVMKQKVQWEKVVPEAYLVLNPDSSVGRVTKADCGIGAREVAAYATTADRFFRFPIVYIEYSGIYGDPAVVKAASDALHDAHLYYGGGIDSGKRAAEMSRFADTIVVGNAVYEKGIGVLKETVDAVQ